MAEFNSDVSQENGYKRLLDSTTCPGPAGFEQVLENKPNDLSVENPEVGCSSSSNIVSHPRMVHNPFAVKSGTTRSMADSTDHKESRPILAPARILAPANTNNNVATSGDSNNTAVAGATASAVVAGTSTTHAPTQVAASKFAFRPSAFDSTGSSASSTFRLNAPILNNPFLRVDAGIAKKVASKPEVSTSRPVPDQCLPDTGQQDMEATVESTETVVAGARDGSALEAASGKECSDSAPTPVFVPATLTAQTATQPLPPTASASNCFCPSSSADARAPPQQSGSFVFGQNMDSRVLNFKSMSGTANGSDAVSFDGKGPHSDGARGTSDVDYADATSDAEDDAASKQVKSLTESALEYESRQVKRTYEEVAVVTGEEDESNVLQIHCKMFTFDKPTSLWVEKGRGLLRLNDKKLDDHTIQSRIVARTQGSLRVVLNAKVWSGMSVDRPNPKSVRLTAQDGEAARIYLITGSAKDIDLLFGALDWRVTALKTSEEKRGGNELFGGGAGRDDTAISSSVATSPNLSTSPCSSSSSSSSSSSCGGGGGGGGGGISITVTTGSSVSCQAGGSSSLDSPGGGCFAGSMASAQQAPPSVSVTAAENLGPKKRRISPPSEQDEENAVAFGRDAPPPIDNTTRVQERQVDSTDNIDSNSCDDSNLSFGSSSTV